MGSDEQAEVSMSMGLVCASEFVFVFFSLGFFGKENIDTVFGIGFEECEPVAKNLFFFLHLRADSFCPFGSSASEYSKNMWSSHQPLKVYMERPTKQPYHQRSKPHCHNSEAS